MAVTVQILDIAHGCAAEGVDVRVERRHGEAWVQVAGATTDDRGRIEGQRWVPAGGGSFRLVIDVQKFFASLGLSAAQAEVSTVLRVAAPDEDRHVHVLLAPSACTLHTDGPAA